MQESHLLAVVSQVEHGELHSWNYNQKFTITINTRQIISTDA